MIEPDFESHEIVGVIPFEPCTVLFSVEGQTFGVPGFYDPINKVFARIDGQKVSKDFNEKLSDFLKKKYNIKEDQNGD